MGRAVLYPDRAEGRPAALDPVNRFFYRVQFLEAGSYDYSTDLRVTPYFFQSNAVFKSLKIKHWRSRFGMPNVISEARFYEYRSEAVRRRLR